MEGLLTNQQEQGELSRWKAEYRGAGEGVVWGRHSEECGIVMKTVAHI